MGLKEIVRRIDRFLYFHVRQCIFSILEYKVFPQDTHIKGA